MKPIFWKSALRDSLEEIEAYARYKSIDFNISSTRKIILKAHQAAFGNVVRARGGHVHEDEFSPREIKRISLLELLSTHLGSEYELLYQEASKDARKRWVSNCRNADKMAHELAKLAFRITRPIWSKIGL